MSEAGRLYSAAQVREIDRRAVLAAGGSGYGLMQRAAAACWRALQARWPQARRIVVVCGSGNNGGDGYEIARLARAAGLAVRVLALGVPRAGSEAEQARAAWVGEGGAVEAFSAEALQGADVIVDALYGIGLSRAPQGEALAAIEAINCRQPRTGVFAVDLPSGLDADTGAAPGVAVRADLTLSVVARKFGLYTGEGPQLGGERLFDALGIEPDAGEPAVAELLHESELAQWLPPRPRGAHKGSHGHVLLIGGDEGTPGAILIAARAALRAGAGLVSVATRASHAAALAAAQPEVMFRGVENEADLAPLLARADVIAIGPGLGTGEWGQLLWRAALAADLPLVVDADALNLLAQSPQQREDWILTPHPGEASRLLGIDTAGIARNRAAAAAELVRRYGGVAVLKGAGSLIRGEALAVCPYGNPGMGTGGMGDLLTGIVAALRAQGLPAEPAARMAVLAHALAGDDASNEGERGLIPSDLLAPLRRRLNPALNA